MGEKVGMGWESSPMPLLCETCLGPNPLVRMSQEPAGGSCKICERPFTIYRWKPGPQARYKKTEVCQMCARVKNVCQTCLFDLQYGLPVQVRDEYLAKAAAALGGAAGAAATLALTTSTAAGGGGGMSDVNRQYALTQAERAMAEGGDGGGMGTLSAAILPEAHAALQRMARTAPYYARNQAKLCSFFAKGECNRGDLCPFRHEMPRAKDDPLAKQNLLDRYHGSNDVLAAKILGKAEARSSAPPPLPPQDLTVRTLWISGIDERVGEEDLRGALGHFGGTGKVRLAPSKGCAFVEMNDRGGAEAAVAALHASFSIGGLPLRLAWAKPKAKEGGGGGGGEGGGMGGKPPALEAAVVAAVVVAAAAAVVVVVVVVVVAAVAVAVAAAVLLLPLVGVMFWHHSRVEWMQ